MLYIRFFCFQFLTRENDARDDEEDTREIRVYDNEIKGEGLFFLLVYKYSDQLMKQSERLLISCYDTCLRKSRNNNYSCKKILKRKLFLDEYIIILKFNYNIHMQNNYLFNYLLTIWEIMIKYIIKEWSKLLYFEFII